MEQEKATNLRRNGIKTENKAYPFVVEKQPLRWCSFALPVVQQVGHFGTSIPHSHFQNPSFGMSLAAAESEIDHSGSEADPFVLAFVLS
jgi:hypothetical protein